MTKDLISVDFRKGIGLPQVLSPPIDLASSKEAAWNNLYFEYRHHDSHETPEHYPTQHVIAIQTSGEVQAERRLNRQLKSEQMTAGDICIVPAHTPHWIYAKGKQGLIFLTLDPAFFNKVAHDTNNHRSARLMPQFATADPLIYQIGLALKDVLQRNASNSNFYAESMTMALSAHLLHRYCEDTIPPNKQHHPIPASLPHRKIQLAIDYIDAHLVDDLSLGAIAQAVEMSQYHFCRAFKQAIGQSPWQYVIQQRVARAKQHLAEPKLSISQVSAAMGFISQGQFSSFFRKYVGTSPSRYRNQL